MTYTSATLVWRISRFAIYSLSFIAFTKLTATVLVSLTDLLPLYYVSNMSKIGIDGGETGLELLVTGLNTGLVYLFKLAFLNLLRDHLLPFVR